MIPALAHEASCPGFCRSNTATRKPARASSSAMEPPITPPPAIATSYFFILVASCYQRLGTWCSDSCRSCRHLNARQHIRHIERSKIYGRFERAARPARRSEEHTSELQSLAYLVCRLLLEKKNKKNTSQ